MREQITETSLKKVGHILADQQGFEGTHDFFDSLLQLHNLKLSITMTMSLTITSTFIEQYLGIKAIVLLGIVLLFSLEMITGIRYARKNNLFDSHKWPRGFIKMGVYLSFIGVANIFSVNLPVPHIPVIEVDFNIYGILYYFFLNLTIVNLFISCIENCVKLGWDEFVPIIGWLHKVMKIKTNTDDKH